MIRLETWSYSTDPDQYLPEELRKTYLHGLVYGHPNLEDGRPVKTSPVRSLGQEEDIIVTAMCHFYKLGEVNPDFEKINPGAKERLIGLIKKKLSG